MRPRCLLSGKPTPDGTVFSREASTAIRPPGRAGGLQPFGYSSQWLQDFDGDGQIDVMREDVKLGAGKQDVLIQQVSSTEPQRVTMLMAR